MMRKEHVFALVLLASLPGCARNKVSEPRHKESTHKSGNDEFAMVDMPLADDQQLADAQSDESVKSYFDEDLNELVTVSEADGREGDADTFAWIENQSDDEQTFETVYFDFDRRRPDDGQTDRVRVNVAKARELIEQAHAEGKNAMLVIEGHACHSAGSATYNLAISEDRAKTLTDQLVNAGIPRAHIKVVGRGKEMPAVHRGKPVTGDRQEQWRNRRVEMNVIYT